MGSSSGYQPLYIRAMEQGLIQSRQDFILPDDAYPVLENAYVWRERIKRKQGYKLLGRLRRTFTATSIGNSGASPWTFVIYSTVAPAITEANKSIQAGSVIIVFGGVTFTDQGNGTLTSVTPGNSGTINYITSSVTLTTTVGAGAAAVATFAYFPGLPAMGLRTRELTTTNNEQTVAFDTVYAYRFSGGSWVEFIAGTTWTGLNSDFFWSTNYWVGDGNSKIFWVTNDSGTSGDPIRYTNGSVWVNFAPLVDSGTTRLQQCKCMLPFRGRLVAFNTLEGAALATSTSYSNRIRWAAIGNPFADVSAAVTVVNANAWRDDLRGQGGFLDIPTSEDIISVGFVRDYLVVYCERSTWQLMYTGRSIAPFQIQKINSELGSESTFSAVQFDTSLVGVGQVGIVSCDSTSSHRIDIKIPDLVFEFGNENFGTKRVHGIRNFQKRLAFWTYVYAPIETTTSGIYPNRRLVYNYENESWAIFTDSLTCLGTFQPQTARKWLDYPSGNPANSWSNQNYSWVDRPALFPSVIGGNQQGFIEYLDEQVSNDVSLYISAITGNTTTPTLITSTSHNLVTGQIIEITGIPAGTPFATSLNNKVFGVTVTTSDAFLIEKYSSVTQQFDDPQLDDPATYVGGGMIMIRDNFSVVSKKFNFLEDGQNIQMGYIDVLMPTTDSGAISLNVYIDYNNNSPVNTLPQNNNPDTGQPDLFFNSVVPTSQQGGIDSTKNWQRVFCPARGSFITIQWTLSNEQMQNICQQSNVQIDSQILWRRPGGRQLPRI